MAMMTTRISICWLVRKPLPERRVSSLTPPWIAYLCILFGGGAYGHDACSPPCKEAREEVSTAPGALDGYEGIAHARLLERTAAFVTYDQSRPETSALVCCAG